MRRPRSLAWALGGSSVHQEVSVVVDSSSDKQLREVPGGARRADTFILVVMTVVTVIVVPGWRHEHPPVLALLMLGFWCQAAAAWTRHVWPKAQDALQVLGAMFFGAALYAAVAGR